ncbi:MAG: class I SAM-dependent methyltransferase [Bacteroidales bacterium]|nr:class I SAM-dependent methyltransferase [Bacteroidales bacterium]
MQTIARDKDAMGSAIADFQKTGKAGTLRVLSSMFDEDQIPVGYLFRTLGEMPPLEQKAMAMAQGKILDVGAGAGCHALALQEQGKEVKAIDISELSCEAMQERGVKLVQCIDFFDPRLAERFDTILLLMNGTGIAGKLSRLPELLKRTKELLNPGGQVLLDSSDLKYLYENEDGTFDINPLDAYYGEVDYQMVYRKVKGEPFDWLYVDPKTLQLVAEANGMNCELVAEGEHYDYLARLSVK